MKAEFYYCHNEYLRNGFMRYDLYFSQQFCEYFSKQFKEFFCKETGLRPSTKVTLAGYKQYNDIPIYEAGAISKLNLVLWIMPEYNDNISFCWKSKSGKIIRTIDESFDEDDLLCWIEGLKPAEYWQHAATEKSSHPFQVANLPFELKVFDFGTEIELRIFTEVNIDAEELKNAVSSSINLFNVGSENRLREDGVVHSFRFEEVNDYLSIRIDTGSAGIAGIKKILSSLAKRNGISRVEIDI
jgi:hypothetical protein